MNNKTFAYLRVSTSKQSLERQYRAVYEYCNEHQLEIEERNIITDTSSGKNFDRPGYQTLKRLLRSNDILIIKELDRLGRNMNEVKNEWNWLIQNNINMIVIDTEIINTQGKSDLERKLISSIVFEILNYLSEKTRTEIRKRQAEGIVVAKAEGRHLGRHALKIDDKFIETYLKWKKQDITAVAAAKQLKISRASFYNLKSKYESDIN